MKTISRSLLFINIAALVLLSSCKDDDAVTKSKTDLLTQNTWKFSSATSSNADLQNLYLLLTGSEITFKKDKTYTATSAFGTDTGKWEFADNEGSIILDKGTQDEEKETITKLDDGALEVTVQDSDFNATVSVKFVKK